MSSIFDKMRTAMSRKGSRSTSSSGQAHYARAASSDEGTSSSSSNSSGGSSGSYQMYQVRLDEPQLGVQIEPTPGDGRPRIIGVQWPLCTCFCLCRFFVSLCCTLTHPEYLCLLPCCLSFSAHRWCSGGPAGLGGGGYSRSH